MDKIVDWWMVLRVLTLIRLIPYPFSSPLATKFGLMVVSLRRWRDDDGRLEEIAI